MKDVKLNDLLSAARGETAPQVDVASSVMQRLMNRRNTPLVNRPLLWITVTSTAAAVASLVISLVTWRQSPDAVDQILNVIAWAAP
jgi:hypothetical protein